MKVVRRNKKYQFLVDFALEILEEKGIPHDNLVFKFWNSDYWDDGWATFALPHSSSAHGEKPTILFNVLKSSKLSEQNMRYCIAHEIGHYRDWLNGNLQIGALSTHSYYAKKEKVANKFAKGIMGYTPSWIAREYVKEAFTIICPIDKCPQYVRLLED